MKIVSLYYTGEAITTILYGIEAASPTLAAIIVMLQQNKFAGLKNFLKEKYGQGFSLKICLLGFATPLVILTIAKLITYLTPFQNSLFNSLSAKKIIIVMWALVAEELGWRGFLQEKLEKRYKKILTPIILGLIWAAWHYHFFILGTLEVPIALFIFGCITESFGYYIITKVAKGNIIPASLWHFSGNLFINIYGLNPNCNGGSIIPYLIFSLLSLFYLIAFVIFYMRGKRCKA